MQWQNQQVPIPIIGRSSQATNSAFWKDTNGAAEGVIFWDLNGPNVAVTPRNFPFAEAFKSKFGNYRSYCGYTAYDEVYFIAEAVRRAKSLDSDKLVTALEQTDFVGTIAASISAEGRPPCAWAAHRRQRHHGFGDAMAERQGGDGVAVQSGQWSDDLPGFRQTAPLIIRAAR